MSSAIEGKTNYVQARSNRLHVYDPEMLAFLLENKTYRPIIEAVRSVKGQQLFVPYVHDIINNKKLSLVKIYPKSAEWKRDADFSGKEIWTCIPSTEQERHIHSCWTRINHVFTKEMLRMQSTVLNGRTAEEFIMSEKDKVTPMSEALKAKSLTNFEEGKSLRTASLNMVYFMERDGDTPPAVGIKFQESFPIDPLYQGKRKRTEAPSTSEEEKSSSS